MRRLAHGWIEHRGFLGRGSPSKNRRSTALHEAAHAVFAEHLGAKVQRLWLVANKRHDTGYTETLWPRVNGRCTDPLAFAIQTLAGHEAEHAAYDRPISKLPAGDYRAIERRGYSASSINLVGYLTRKLLPGLMPEIRRVQKALLEKGRLSRRLFLGARREGRRMRGPR